MDLVFNQVTEITEDDYKLLLDADPYKKMVDSYITRSTVFEVRNVDKLVGIVALLPTRPETLEIVNIAVAPEQQNLGIGTQILDKMIAAAKTAGYSTLEIGTGSNSYQQLHLYQKVGFRMSWIDKDFFINNYPKKVIEDALTFDGFILRDMVRLTMKLR
ncbi:GNAT family N-acetyltransferase [Companilactobacillus hulinensis]|uniref:GNAT family N-acetyltransferase n=1 Tax=Companilactobacillus hulinensis TaxID=2486007 RepID=UPI000F7B98B3|nr:GNAT family N-acetyltransferase [Companilactobacillus hulinensis]